MIPALRPTGQSRSTEDVIRGSTNIPLSAEGVQEAKERGIQFARKGGVDSIIASSLHRGVETAQLVHKANPKSSFKEVTRQLHPWHLGCLEGQPTSKVLDQMNSLIIDYPDRVPSNPPPGSMSTEPAESFNRFKTRFFDFLGGVIQRYLANPKQKILLVTHYRVLKLMQAWQKEGFPQDFHIDHKEVTRKDGVPGDAWILQAHNIHGTLHDNWSDWTYRKLDMESLDKIPDGIIFYRHGFTVLNGERPGSINMPINKNSSIWVEQPLLPRSRRFPRSSLPTSDRCLLRTACY